MIERLNWKVKMKNLFDNDYIKINDAAFRYVVIIIILLTILIIGLNVLKKDYYYQNIVKIKEKEKVILIVDKKYINKIKENSEIIINDIIMNYNIEKIEEIENMYYVTIKLECEVDLEKVSTYKILLSKEKYISYFIRIIKGGI